MVAEEVGVEGQATFRHGTSHLLRLSGVRYHEGGVGAISPELASLLTRNGMLTFGLPAG